MVRGTVWLAALSLMALAAPSGARPEDRAALLEGVRSVASPGVPGGLSVFGPEAFPVVAGRLDNGLLAPMIAGSRLGEGRILAFGHDGFVNAQALRTGRPAGSSGMPYGGLAGRGRSPPWP